ncbi:Nmad2 family putative nucleotide modification protein [Fibrella forsythiae]|uniref:Nucleotide modification associated domain-containing protein n=1 Tax=Fibrella forsythiae TaxID=2817061 RepID=A0ABS3JSF0_9BACT|nr:hypothetical protein [Fibrella forsythiae]MBO0952898.1 hypothetical protein [Fibrella forsythiae]
MARVYIYVVDRDLGFAPNPFHGVCTLATCKPGIRSTAKIGDWIFGVGGRTLKAPGQLVYAMKVSQKLTFNEYWLSEEFKDKRPVRNGSKKMMLGDNIYFQNTDNSWLQAHSHHSLEDGGINLYNLNRDTKSKNVLVSKHFYYFGSSAPEIPSYILSDLGYKNNQGHRIFSLDKASRLVDWLEHNFTDCLNIVLSDPFNFDKSAAHYSVKTNRMM